MSNLQEGMVTGEGDHVPPIAWHAGTPLAGVIPYVNALVDHAEIDGSETLRFLAEYLAPAALTVLTIHQDDPGWFHRDTGIGEERCPFCQLGPPEPPGDSRA